MSAGVGFNTFPDFQQAAAAPNDVDITSGGSLNVNAANNTNGSATSDGSAVAGEAGGTSQVGIGVAVSVNAVTETNTAYLGRGTHTANGVNVTAQGRGVIINATGTSAVRSMAVAGTAAGSVAISLSASGPVITMDTVASVGAGVKVDKMAGTAGANQSLTVAAASDVCVLGFSGAVAGAGHCARFHGYIRRRRCGVGGPGRPVGCGW